MNSIFSFLEIISFALSSTSNKTEWLDYCSERDVEILRDKEISTYGDYLAYLKYDSISKSSSSVASSLGKALNNIDSHLNTEYSSYYWIKDLNRSNYTNVITDAIPIEMQLDPIFPKTEIIDAVQNSTAANYTNYGGCGPIAIIGILDYFNRYFVGFSEYLPSPYSSNGRIELATNVFNNIDWNPLFTLDPDTTFVNPISCAAAFNTVAINYGIGDILSANAQWHLFGYDYEYLWNTIVENIDKGMPVSMVTGLDSGNGEFSQHVTNVYGYETWVGIDNLTGDRLTKRFLKARLNWGNGYDDPQYCDADILGCNQIGLITYNLHYRNRYNITAQDFSSFVNNNGQGQYFFNNRYEEIILPDGRWFETNRLRTSYIENQYLVMSPNRTNAGTAYLHLAFPHRIQKMSFSAAMWSSFEGTNNQTFTIEYDDPDIGWVPLKTINLSSLSTNKMNPDHFLVYFPIETYDVRFYTQHSAPSGDRNKGRICLDDFLIEYFV